MDGRIAGNRDRSSGDGGRFWNPVEEAQEVAGMWTVKEYIQRQQSRVVAYIVNQPIYMRYTQRSENILISSMFVRWWDQDVG